jgi:hypothetical protein
LGEATPATGGTSGRLDRTNRAVELERAVMELKNPVPGVDLHPVYHSRTSYGFTLDLHALIFTP